MNTEVTVETDAEMRALGQGTIAPLLQRGDLCILTGDLGAGKTTLAQGIGAGLGVRGTVTSPTFIIARTHRPLEDGPAMIHVDAYRLESLAELDDLDLDSAIEDSVTVVEWGEDLAEALSDSHLLVTIVRPQGALGAGEPQDGPRTVTIRGAGERWSQ